MSPEEEAQIIGALGFGLLGAGVGALLGSLLPYRWAEVGPLSKSHGDVAWSLGITLDWPSR